MTRPNWTEGRWEYKNTTNTDGYTVVSVSDRAVMKDQDGNRWPLIFKVAQCDREGDAHLIAAAPDLYEALRPLFEMADHYEVDDDHFVYFNAGKGITAGDIRRAKVIASKARGEQP